MNIFRRIFGADFWRDIVSAFRIHPLSAIISLFATALLIADIMQLAGISITLQYFALIAFCLALGVESLYMANVRDCVKWQIAKCAIFAIIATPIYFYIARENIASPTFYLRYYALCVIFALIFVALHLGNSFRSLYNATIRVIFLCVVCGLFGVLLLIFALLCDTLFGVSIYYFALSVEICALEAIFLLFLATFRRDIEANFGIILRILNVFAVLYLAVFVLYFISVFALGANMRVSIVHLVLWYSFFALFLWWLNIAKMGESLGESRESIKSAHESNRESAPKITSILTRFAPLGALFALNIIAFYATILRIAQYGVTIERYFVIIGCIALLVNLGFSAFCKKPIAKGIVAIIALVAFSAFGWKFNAIDLSLHSQYKELEIAQNGGDEARIANIKRFIAYYEGNTGKSAPNEAHSEEAKFFTFDDFSAILDSKAILRIKHSSGDILSQTSGNYRYEISDDKFVRVYQIAPKSPVACEFDLKAIARNLDKNIIKISGATIIIQSLSANFRYDSHQKPIGVDIWDFDIIILLQ